MGASKRTGEAAKTFCTAHKCPIYTVLALCLLATFVNPFSREIQVLMFRLYFNLQGDIIVQGQPPGCAILPIPNVHFSYEYSKKLAALPSTSTDNCLLKDCLGGGFRRDATDIRQPPTTSWRGHPLQAWVALRCALDMGDFVSDEFQSSAPIKYCAALIEDALAAAPKNGALYLARAKLRFLAGDVEGAKRDWLNASQTEVWSKGERHLKTHVGRLYREAGLPTVEAAGEAATRNFFIADSFEKPLRKLLVDAVNANDDRAQRETGELMRLLYRSLRLKIHGEWRNYSEPFMDVALIGAIANKDPDNQLDTDAITLRKGPEHYEKAKLVVRDYLETHMGKNLHTGVVEEFENLQKEMERLSKMQDERFFRSIA